MTPGLALDSGEFIPASELNMTHEFETKRPKEHPPVMIITEENKKLKQRVAELEAQTTQLTASLETASSAVIVLKQQQRDRRAQLATGREPVAWMVFWGLGKKRPGAIFVEREHAVSHAKQIKSETEICPVYAHPAPTGIPQADCLWARNGNSPCTPSPAQQPSIDEVMDQAQVFASAWSLVGGRFDNGDMLDEANKAKAELRAMLASKAGQK